MSLRTLDCHVGGQAVRLIVEGFPAPRGRSMLDRLDWAAAHADDVRRALLLEPRGHRDMCGAVLTEPASPAAHAGVLFMDAGGFAPMSGTGIVGVTTIALERRLLVTGDGSPRVVFDTAAGLVRADAVTAAIGDAQRVERVRYLNVPSFVLIAGFPVKIGARTLRADIVYGGAFYAIVDAESAGLGVNPSLAPELRRTAGEIKAAIEAAHAIAHPLEPRIASLEGIIFTAPPSNETADLRSVTVFGDGAVDRSPGGNSTAALMAVLSAMGLLEEGNTFTHESIMGSVFTASIVARTLVGDHEAIVASIEASGFITGEHTFVASADDPLRGGFLL